MVLPRRGIANADEAEALRRRVADSAVDTALEADLDQGIEGLALEPVNEVLDAPAQDRDRAPTPTTVQGDHRRVGALLETDDEVAAVAVDAGEELEASVIGL